MKKRTMITADQIVSIWRMKYKDSLPFTYISQKLGIGAQGAYQAYRTVGQYMHGEYGKTKFKSYLEASRIIKKIIKEEIEKPKQEEVTEKTNGIKDITQTVVNADTNDPYNEPAGAMQNLQNAIESVIAYNSEKEKARILKVMEEAKYSNWSDSLRKKFAGE